MAVEWLHFYVLFTNLVLALNAFNCVSSWDFLPHTSCLDVQMIYLFSSEENATHYRTRSPKCYHVHFCVTFQRGPCVPAFIFSVKMESLLL